MPFKDPQLRRQRRIANPLSFKEARRWARSLGLGSANEWRRLAVNHMHPRVPKDASSFYADEWVSFGDWLGTGSLPPGKKKFRSFAAARKWVRANRIQSDADWFAAIKSGRVPQDIPRSLRHVYRDQWTSSGDFYGTGRIATFNRKWRSLVQAKRWAAANGISTPADWREASKEGKLPIDIPALPTRAYNVGWPEFFGNKVRGGASLTEAIIAHELAQFFYIDKNIKTIKLTAKRRKRVDIVLPKARAVIEYDGARWHASRVAEDRGEITLFRDAGWRLIRIREEPLRPLSPEDVVVSPGETLHRRMVVILNHLLRLGLVPERKRSAVRRYVNQARLSPQSRQVSSASGWLGFKEARAWARSLGLTSTSHYRKHIREHGMPKNVPSAPEIVYEVDWIDWADFLGTKNKHYRRREWRSYEQARQWVKEAGITNSSAWNDWVRKDRVPEDIPRRPHGVYEQWVSYPHWFGQNVIKGQRRYWLSFEKARAWARKSGAKSEREWRELVRRNGLPKGIPTNPQKVYLKEWIGLGDWLGSGTRAPGQQNFLPFAGARIVVRALGLRSESDWRKYKSNNQLPKGVPASPAWVYRKEGWLGWGDWLRG